MSIRVGVLRGGAGSEYYISLATGKEILFNLSIGVYKPIDIFVDRSGVFHIDGIPKTLESVANSVDVVFNALHGFFGENGSIKRDFEKFGKPVIGADVFAGVMTSNKENLKNHLKSFGVLTPKSFRVGVISDKTLAGFEDDYIYDVAKKVFDTMPGPWIIKPTLGGSSFHTHRANTFDELVFVLKHFSETDHDVMIEQFVFGREFVLGGIKDFREKDFYHLLPVWVKRPNKNFSHEYWHEGDYSPILSRELGLAEKQKMTDYLDLIKKELDPNSYFTFDGIVNPKGVYLIEVDSHPALHKDAPFQAKLKSVGSNMSEFLDSVIRVAFKRK